MANMSSYFKTQIGNKITKSVKTGKTFFTEVFERVYTIEVLEVNRGKLTVDVSCYDKVPSGYRAGDTFRHIGEVTVSMGTRSKGEIIDDIVVRMDPNFFVRYPGVLKAM
jgi:hypothetical protein